MRILQHRYALVAAAAVAVVGWGAVIVAPTGASAQIVTTPPVLSPGDQYRLAFVTKTTQDATSSDIADYNLFVTLEANTQAALAALGATWKAIGSTRAIAARDNTGTKPPSAGGTVGVPIFRLDGTKIADDNADLWDGAIPEFSGIDAPLNVFVDGSPAAPQFVWTGTFRTGITHSCPLGPPGSGAGLTSNTALEWIEAGCGSSAEKRFGLYGLSSILTVPPPAAAEADLTITKTDSPDPVVAGQTLTYTVEVANGGPDDAENVVVGDTLPSAVTFVGTSGCVNDANGVPTCQLGTIANSTSKSYTITVTVDATTAAGTITNAATVTSDADDPVPGDNTVTEDTEVIELVDIDIHPGSFPNSINSCSKGAIPIAILGSASLDVTDIDPDSLTFAGAGVKMVGKSGRALCSMEDVSGPPPGPGGADDPTGVPDGLDDLVCHFVTVELADIISGDTSASVQGAFLSGGAFVGTDSINIVKDACLP